LRPLGELKILVIDASAGVRSELCARLGALGWTVLADASGTDVASVIDVFRPDLVLAELTNGDPQHLVEMMQAGRPIPVIVSLPASADPRVRALALRAGAEDVVAKPFEVDEVLMRIQHALHRTNGDQGLVHIEDLVIDEPGHIVRRGEAELELTVTEFNLLMALVRNAGHVMSKRQLLSTVWGFDDYDVNLVEVHVSALRRKLEQYGPRLIQTVRGIGYVLRPNNRGAQFHRRPAMTPQPSLF
jgi:two-component system, OmpR family, response regulator